MAYKCISLNVNGIAEKTKRDLIYDYLRAYKADIVFLQEAHNDSETNEQLWSKEWGGSCMWSRGSNRSRGVAILFKPGLDPTLSNILRDNDGRVISATININGTIMNLMNIYAPTGPKERKEFFESLRQYQPGDQNLLLAGDFNCIENLDLDKQGGNPNSGKTGIEELEFFVNGNTLIDTWRDTHKHDRIYTWSNKDFSIRTRLDRWYIPHNLRATSSIRACPYSDHSLVEISVTPNRGSRGKGFWKLNVSLLKDKSFQREIHAFHQFWRGEKDNFPSTSEWWDAAKYHYKGIAVKHAVRKSRARRKKEEDINNKLTELKNALNPDKNRIHELEHQLEELVTQRLEGVKIRSRATWCEHGEKPTRFFFNLERKKQNKATITKLQTSKGEITSPEDILAETRKFYQKLYSPDPTDAERQNELLNNLTKSLDHHQSRTCEGPVTEAELLRAVKKLNMNKTPGPDGIASEFYQSFWSLLKDDLIELFNNCYLSDSLTHSQQMSILRLLFKKNDPTLLKNWRPISLVNSDYKILATVIATRLRNVLPFVVEDDQTCGVPDRSINENILRLRDMAYAASKNNSPLILINLDQEKAFDRVDRQFLMKILQKMNFGPSFQHWITVLYAGAKSQVINNGLLSDPIHLHRGLRQGCPLSPLLYTLVIETLAATIRADPKIEGISVPGTPKRSKISAYADDGTLTLRDDTSVTRCFDKVTQFEAASGSKLNLEKTEGIYIGQQAGRAHGPVPIQWKVDHITVLGTTIGNNMNQNWQRAVERIEENFERWSARKLTMKGKAVIIRTFAIAGIVYLASFFPVPRWVTERITRAIFNFLWSGKNERVSRETCYLPLDRGGLGIPDMQIITEAALGKWVKSIVNREKNELWVHYARYWSGTALSTLKPEWSWLRSNLKPHADPTTTPKWYKILIRLLQEHKQKLPTLPDHSLTSKTLRAWQQKDLTPRAEREWKRITHPWPDFETAWKQLWSSLATNVENDFIWQLIHRVLPTRAYLAKWGMSIPETCPYCNERETWNHALILCQRARALWRRMQHLIDKLAGQKVLVNITSIAFGNNLPAKSPGNHLAHYVIISTAYVLWSTRNRQVVKPDAQPGDIYHQVLNRIRRHIRTEELISQQRITDIWSHEEILCKYKNNRIIFNF